MEDQQDAAVPTEAELEKSARALLAAGRAVLPIKIDGIPLKAGSPKRHFTHIEGSDTNFVRMWLASLLHRTLNVDRLQDVPTPQAHLTSILRAP